MYIDEQELSQPKQQGLGIKPFKLSKTTDFVEELSPQDTNWTERRTAHDSSQESRCLITIKRKGKRQQEISSI